MSGLSEAELHVQAMRLVCEALQDREQDGLEVDWDVIRQMHDQMDAMLQDLGHKHRYDSSEIVDLRKERDAALASLTRERLDAEERGEKLDRLHEDHARLGRLVEARGQELYDYGKDISAIWLEILQVDIAFPEEASLVQSLQILRESHVAARAEIETLRQQLADAQREAVNLQKLHDHLRPRLDAAQGQLTRERLDAEERGQELERLRAFVDLSRRLLGVNINYSDVDRLRAALAELDAYTAEPTPVAEPAPCPECERLRREIEEAYASGFRSMATALAELDAGTSEPTPHPIAEVA